MGRFLVAAYGRLPRPPLGPGCERGTFPPPPPPPTPFSFRSATAVLQPNPIKANERPFFPLLRPFKTALPNQAQARFGDRHIFRLLSKKRVLGFEFGYSLGETNMRSTLWESK